MVYNTFADNKLPPEQSLAELEAIDDSLYNLVYTLVFKSMSDAAKSVTNKEFTELVLECNPRGALLKQRNTFSDF